MSELDAERRGLLAKRLEGGGQALLTATGESALPPVARQAVIEMPGAQRRPHLAAA
jgi:recombinational DNA repair ATPase RecF